MNTQRLRMKNSKKGVTPVIATIILIAGTLVLALVVGAYTFGLFGSNVKTVTLSSATLYGGVSATGSTACYLKSHLVSQQSRFAIIHHITDTDWQWSQPQSLRGTIDQHCEPRQFRHQFRLTTSPQCTTL